MRIIMEKQKEIKTEAKNSSVTNSSLEFHVCL
jgi:hypothetical protein